MKRALPPITFLVLISLCGFLIYHLFPLVHPFYGIHLPLDKTEIEKRAFHLADSLHLSTQDKWLDIRLQRNKPLIRQFQAELGIRKSNQVFRQGLPGYFWKVEWMNYQDVKSISISNETKVDFPDSAYGKKWMFDVWGNLIHFEQTSPPEQEPQKLTAEEAKEVARAFLQRYSFIKDIPVSTANDSMITHTASNPFYRFAPLELVKNEAIQHEDRSDYRFLWKTRLQSTHIDDRVTVRVDVRGNAISRLDIGIDTPAEFNRPSFEAVRAIVSALIIIAIAIITILLAFKRWRAYELSFRFATGLAVIVAITFDIFLYQSLPPSMGWTILFPLIFTPLFMGGIFIFVWAVAESIGREAWNEKFISVDLLRNKFFLHSRIGMAILRGITVGAIAFAAWLVMVWLIEPLHPLQIVHREENTFQFLSAASPVLSILSYDIFITIFATTSFIVLLLSLLRKWISSPYLLLPILAFFLIINYQFNTEPAMIGIVIEGAGVLMVLWSFYRYDLLTSFIAMFTVVALEPGVTLFTTGNPSHQASGYGLIGVLMLFVGYALVCLVTRDRITDFQRLTPDFVKNISERERLQKELEIAREVQMGFLPKENPRFTMLDIASRCTPAQEVGGDYFDFIPLDDHRLGIAIGDVSGKGTQAAFYMTLTKGFLRALAQNESSPARVLAKLNRLFYENARRGVFISMIYGIFDNRNHVLTIARAGHNPLVMRRTEQQSLQAIHPKGLAIGMEKGKVFEQTIQEVKIPFQANDLFVFYTDGCTEAMNRDKEEFGEERFHAIIERNFHVDADEVLESIFSKIHKFTGRAKQHDDMTVVVVKIQVGDNEQPLPLRQQEQTEPEFS